MRGFAVFGGAAELVSGWRALSGVAVLVERAASIRRLPQPGDLFKTPIALSAVLPPTGPCFRGGRPNRAVSDGP